MSKWIKWVGGECPVEKGVLVDVKYADGRKNIGVSALTYYWEDGHVRGSFGRTAYNWGKTDGVGAIAAYRLSKTPAERIEKIDRKIAKLQANRTELLIDPNDMIDWRNWTAGDLVECVNNHDICGITVGTIYELIEADGSAISFSDDDGDWRTRSDLHNFKWHSRPNAYTGSNK